jgi:hypothetical protein
MLEVDTFLTALYVIAEDFCQSHRPKKRPGCIGRRFSVIVLGANRWLGCRLITFSDSFKGRVLGSSLLLSTSVTVTEVRKRRRNGPRSAEIGRRLCDVMAASSGQIGAPPNPISFPSGS